MLQKKEKNWQGSCEFLVKHSSFSLDGNSRFSLESGTSLNIHNVHIEGPDTVINGQLSCDLLQHTLDGSFFAHILNLYRFQDLFPRSNLDGNLGAEVHFSTQKEMLESPLNNLYHLMQLLRTSTILTNSHAKSR